MNLLDRIIKSGSNTDGSTLRVHNFSLIQEPVSNPGLASSNPSTESFKSGLIRQENRCPTLSGMGAMLSKKPSTSHRVAGVSDGPETKPSDAVEEQQTVACILERFNEAVQKLAEERDAMYERAAEETVKLALAISKKVINHEVSINPDMVLGMVRKAMQKIKDGQSIRLRVHPQDLNTLSQASLDKSDKGGAAFKGLVFQADDSLAPGDCLIETRQENIDASISSQLAVIEEAFVSLGDLSQDQPT